MMKSVSLWDTTVTTVDESDRSFGADVSEIRQIAQAKG
jgi:hypothetical protein